MEMIAMFIYVIIGIIVMRMYWDKRYAEEYQKCKEQGCADDSMAVLMMLVLILFWPIAAIKLIFIKS